MSLFSQPTDKANICTYTNAHKSTTKLMGEEDTNV